jgi:hypothetical protein
MGITRDVVLIEPFTTGKKPASNDPKADFLRELRLIDLGVFPNSSSAHLHVDFVAVECSLAARSPSLTTARRTILRLHKGAVQTVSLIFRLPHNGLGPLKVGSHDSSRFVFSRPLDCRHLGAAIYGHWQPTLT